MCTSVGETAIALISDYLGIDWLGGFMKRLSVMVHSCL